MQPNNYPTGFFLPSQFPLDFKLYFKTLAEMLDLGLNNNLAFTYYWGMIVYCKEDNQLYIWEPVNARKAQSKGLLENGFTYPPGSPNSNGITYENVTFNFFHYRYSITGYINYLYGSISQEGTDNPVLVIKSTDLPNDENLNLFYDSQGNFRITHPLFSDPMKLHVEIPAISNILDDIYFVKTSIAGDGDIRISTVDIDNNVVNSVLTEHPISIYYFGSNIV